MRAGNQALPTPYSAFGGVVGVIMVIDQMADGTFSTELVPRNLLSYSALTEVLS